MDFKGGNRGSMLKYFITALSGAVLGLFMFITLGSPIFSRFVPRFGAPQQQAPQQVPQVDRLSMGGGTDVSAPAGQVIPSVVGITITKIENGRRVQGVGSGVIVDSTGYILTNNHVAGGQVERMAVSLYDGRDVPGTTIWADPTLDLAIVKVNENRLPTVILGNSGAVRVGQPAIAIGNPLGLAFQRTVTAGIISAINRTIELRPGVFMEDLLQTDASINPGNSGGPLINVSGEVVGINTIKVTTAEAIGFAVPINVVKPVIDKIRSSGGFSTPDVALQAIDRQLGRVYGFTADKGVYVFDCKDGGYAYTAGIRKGDTILSVDGNEINTAIELKEALYRADRVVKLRVRNSQGEMDVYITLDVR